jgi:hypothetical protein
MPHVVLLSKSRIVGRRTKTWTFSEFGDDNIATNVTIYEYVDDEVGNWIERREYYLWRDDSYQSKRVTMRTLTYYPVNSFHEKAI